MEATGSNPAPDPPCGRCLTQRAPYTCPRCHLRFCSVPCYREHGSCASDFQNRQLQLRLQGQRVDEASQRRLREALFRLHERHEPGDEDFLFDPDPQQEALLWEGLSPEQRKAFQRLLNSGEISRILPPWKPWWEVGCGNRGAALVQELDSTDAQKVALGNPRSSQDIQQATQPEKTQPPPEEILNSIPAVIPPLASLTNGPVSPLVRFQLPNALYGYAYSLSLYNGDVDKEADLLPEFCETVLDLSGALGAKQIYRSAAEALQSALQAVSAGRYPECPLGNAGVMVAVAQILMGECQAKQKGFALVALGHLSRLLSKGRKLVPAEDRARLFGAKKKCGFLLSWVNENEEELTLLALEVQQEYKAYLDTLKEVGAVTQELEKLWGAKVPPPKKNLIEELD